MDALKNDNTGIVIAGGKSLRMGQNKALMDFNGHRLIDRAIGILEPITSQILISSNIEIPNLKYPCIADIQVDSGPLGGLFACLQASTSELNLVIACDTPFVSTQIYNEMLALAQWHDAVVPVLSNGHLEPLVGIYKKSTLPMIEELLQNGLFKMNHFCKQIDTHYYPVNNTGMFKNLNTPTDLTDGMA